MTENYEDCRRCRGTGLVVVGREFDGTAVSAECGVCDGTGMGGAAEAYTTAQAADEHGRELHEIGELREVKKG